MLWEAIKLANQSVRRNALRSILTLHLLVYLPTGALTLDTENPGDVGGWTADNNLVVRAADINTPDGGTLIRVRDSANSPWRELTKWGPEESFGGVAGFAADNKTLWLISSVGANASRLVEIPAVAPAKGGKAAAPAQRVIAEDPAYDVSGAMVHPTTKKLEAVSFTRARTEWKALDPAVEVDFAALGKVRDADFFISSRDLADKTWIVSFVSDDGPVYYYAYDRATKQATQLFSNRPALEKFKLAKMKPISFTTRDGMTIHGVGRLKGITGRSFDDHRIAMSLAVAGLVSDGPVKIEGAGAADISYPTFWRDLELIGGSLG